MRADCKHGHPLDERNLYIAPSGQRQCRECNRLKARRRYSEKHPGPRKRGADYRAKHFDEFWTPEPNSGCWLWLGTVRHGGYGVLYVQGRQIRAHRFSWEREFGKIGSPKILVCHKCDNRLCVNPQHLFLGTAKDNMEDMTNKGRRAIKIPEVEYGDIVELFDSGIDAAEIAKTRGVHQSTIYRILRLNKEIMKDAA